MKMAFSDGFTLGTRLLNTQEPPSFKLWLKEFKKYFKQPKKHKVS